MITTAVQQASQMVEVQGAPPAVQVTGDEFRVTLTASVTGPDGEKSAPGSQDRVSGVAAGLSYDKQRLVPGLFGKESSLTKSGRTASPLNLKDADLKGTVSGAATETDTASSARLKAGSELVLKNTATADAVADASSVGVGSRSVVPAEAGDESPLRIPGAPSSVTPIPVAANELAEPTAVQKDDGPSKPLDSLVAARVRKNEASSESKEAGHAGAQAIASGTAAADGPSTAVPVVHPAQLEAAVVVPAQQVAATEGGLVAQKGAEAGVLTSAIEASDGTKTISGTPIRPVETSDLVSVPVGWNEVASSRRDAFALPDEDASSAGPGTASTVFDGSKIASGTTGAAARSGPQSSQMVDAALRSARDDSSTTATRVAVLGATAPSADDVFEKPMSGLTQTKSDSGSNRAEAKTPVSSEGPVSTAALQARPVEASHSTPIPHAPGTSKPDSSKVSGDVQDSAADSKGNEPGRALAPASTLEALASGGLIATPESGSANITQPLARLRDATPETSTAHEAPSKATGLTTKDDKTKAAADGPEGTSATRSLVAQDVPTDTSSGSANNPVALVSSVAERAIPVTNAIVPISQATPHIVLASAHTNATDPSTAVSARTLGTVSAASLSESVTLGVQSVESHRTLVATPMALEVGVQSGTQGWLRIRAEVGDQGAVNASLAAGSSGARELLHSQMPALNAFLHSEQMSVTTTVVDRGATSAGDQGGALGSGGQGNQYASGGANSSLPNGGGAQSDSNERGASQYAPNGTTGKTGPSYDSWSGVSEAEGSHTGRAMTSEESGRWLNVRV